IDRAAGPIECIGLSAIEMALDDVCSDHSCRTYVSLCVVYRIKTGYARAKATEKPALSTTAGNGVVSGGFRSISSALVITLGAVKLALACIRKWSRRRVTCCSVHVPRRRRRRQRRLQREPCQRPHAAVRTAVRYRADPPAPDRPSVA